MNFLKRKLQGLLFHLVRPCIDYAVLLMKFKNTYTSKDRYECAAKVLREYNLK